jgi:hypothetical protein
MLKVVLRISVDAAFFSKTSHVAVFFYRNMKAEYFTETLLQHYRYHNPEDYNLDYMKWLRTYEESN